jgi:acyl-CoA thioesterase I
MLSTLFAYALATSPAGAGNVLPSDLQSVRRIVMLGDSITQGGGGKTGYVTLVGNALKAAYPERKIEIVNAGIGGHKAPDMAARFKRDVLDKRPDLITISVGVNDVWHNFRSPDWSQRQSSGDSGRGVALPDFLRNVEDMVDRAKEQGIQVILVSPSLIYEDLKCAENKRAEEYTRAGAALARRKGIKFVDMHRPFREAVSAFQKQSGMGSLLLTTDGVHLNDAGNALFAHTILKALGVPVANTVSPR